MARLQAETARLAHDEESPLIGDLQTRLWFAAGTTVSVVAMGEGFSVVTEGQALSPGLEGQAVRVRTEGGRVLAGHATGERRVEVRL